MQAQAQRWDICSHLPHPGVLRGIVQSAGVDEVISELTYCLFQVLLRYFLEQNHEMSLLSVYAS